MVYVACAGRDGSPPAGDSLPVRQRIFSPELQSFQCFALIRCRRCIAVAIRASTLATYLKCADLNPSRGLKYRPALLQHTPRATKSGVGYRESSKNAGFFWF